MRFAPNLTDPQVAALARQAVDLLDPDVGIDIAPEPGSDPYARGGGSWLVWPLIDGHRAFGIYVSSAWTAARALAHLIDGLAENSSESGGFWARPFPACATGHRHPADVDAEADEVVLRCPQTREVVGRIRPAL
jgi:hypothetical protein